MEKRDQTYMFLAILLIVVLGVGTYLRGPSVSPTTHPSPTGYQSAFSGTSPSSVVINPSASADLSPGLLDAGGITFDSPGSVSTAIVDINASENYLYVASPTPHNETSLFVIVRSSTNFAAKVCVRGSGNMIDAVSGASIPLAGYKYSAALDVGTTPGFNSTATPSYPPIDLPENTMSTIYATVIPLVADTGIDQYALFRFWLDIPQNQLAGTYQNSIDFKVVKNDAVC